MRRRNMWSVGVGLVVALMLGVFGLGFSGCASDGSKSERLKAAAPTPPEAKLIANQVMRFALSEKDYSIEELQTIRGIMLDAKVVLVTALQESPTTLDAVRMDYLKTKNPEMGELANTVLQILVLRLRPLIDQGKTDLAGQYIESVIDGAALAINTKIGFASVRYSYDWAELGT